MSYYYPNEVLYPDYNTFAQPSDFNAPYQAYNFEKPMGTNDFYFYGQQSPRFDTPETTISRQDPEIEEILRSNDEVWDAYQTGRFSVVTQFEDGHKKIILKEKVTSDIDDSEFIIRRYKVFISSPRNSKVRDDDVLLVSFSQKSINQKPQHQQLEIEQGMQLSNQNLIPYRKTESQILTGPGTELINRIVNGEDDSFEIVEDMGHYEPAYEIQTSPSKTSSRVNKNLSREFFEKAIASSSTRSTETSSAQSDAEDYIDEIINKIKSQVRDTTHDSRSHYSATQLSHQQMPNASAATPASASYIGGGGSTRYVDSLGESQYNEDVRDFVVHEDSFGHVSRSSTRNVQDQHDTHSIGPGSMAGGSLFGGYIPNHVEHTVIEKSAFSEYNLTRNENGDYVLQEANGRSEIFDGKSGFSLGKSNIGSRSQLSRGEESRSNLSRMENTNSTRG